VSIFVNINIRN